MSRPAQHPLRRLALAAACWGALSCLDISSPVTGIGSISQVISPAPSVVVGDTARDSTNPAVPLRVVAFAPNGDTVRDANVEFFVLDTSGGLVLTPGGLAYGAKLSPAAKVVARVTPAHGSGALQTDTLPLPVVPVPTRLTASTTSDTIHIDPSATDTLRGNDSPGLAVLLHGPDTSVVRRYLVRYAIDSVPPGREGQPLVRLVDEGGHPSMVDTTDLSGTASRILHLRLAAVPPELLAAGAIDSVIVHASVIYRGGQVEGSPMRFVVYIRSPF